MHRLAAALVAVTLSAAACGADDPSGSGAEGSSTTEDGSIRVDGGAREADLERLLDTPWTTTATGSAVTHFHAEVVVSGSGKVDLTGAGVTDFSTQQGTLELDASEILEANELGSVSGPFDIVFDVNNTYLKADLINVLFNSPTQWVLMRAGSLPASGDSPFADGLRGLTQFAGHDPAMPLDLLRGIRASTLQRTGVGVVQGADTTSYTAEVDVRRAFATVPSAVRDRFVEILGGTEVHIEVHIDGDGRLRRLMYGDGHGGSISFEYSNFGVNMPFEVPVESDVTPIEDVLPI